MRSVSDERQSPLFTGVNPLSGFFVDRFWRPIRTEFLSHEPGRLAIGLIVLALVLESASAFDGQYSAGSLVILGVMCFGVVVGSSTSAHRQISAIVRSLEAMRRSTHMLREKFPDLTAATTAVDVALSRADMDLAGASRFDYRTRRRYSLRWSAIDRHIESFINGDIDQRSAAEFLAALLPLITTGGALVKMRFLDICRSAAAKN